MPRILRARALSALSQVKFEDQILRSLLQVAFHPKHIHPHPKLLKTSLKRSSLQTNLSITSKYRQNGTSVAPKRPVAGSRPVKHTTSTKSPKERFQTGK